MSDNLELDIELHKKQTEAFLSHATEILYGGAAGGGKSHLMRVAAIYWCVAIPGLMVYIFRRLSDDLAKNHLEGPGGFFAMLAPWIEGGYAKYNGSKNYIEFWNGSKIFLAHCQHEKDRIKYQGAEIHVLLVDELTHFTKKIYAFLRARMRLGSLNIPKEFYIECEFCKGKGCQVCKDKGERCLFPRVIAGSNPGGTGHNFVKRDFVDMSAPMTVKKMVKSEGGLYRQYIPAKLDDNPTLLENDPDYVDRLEGLGDPSLVKAMKNGDWNIVSGGALDDVWSYDKHVLTPFNIPWSWKLDRSFDWGSTHPFSVLWFAESDGSEVKLSDGSIFCPPAGSLIVFKEWYGGKSGTNEGLKMSAASIASGILIQEKLMIKNNFIIGTVKPGPADNQISNVNESNVDTIAQKMKKKGIKWTKSDKSPGSRINGLQLIRDMLKSSSKSNPEDPGLYFFNTCINLVSHLPVLPRDPNKTDDVDTKSEDHDYDALRYRVLNKKRAKLDQNELYL